MMMIPLGACCNTGTHKNVIFVTLEAHPLYQDCTTQFVYILTEKNVPQMCIELFMINKSCFTNIEKFFEFIFKKQDLRLFNLQDLF